MSLALHPMRDLALNGDKFFWTCLHSNYKKNLVQNCYQNHCMQWFFPLWLEPAFLLLANFRQILTWKIWVPIPIIWRIFHEKIRPISPDFEKLSTNRQNFITSSSRGSQKYRKILIFSYFHIRTCGQIWLNHFPDDGHLSYITKLEKETLAGTPSQVNRHPLLYLRLLNQRRPLRANEEMSNLNSVTLI